MGCQPHWGEGRERMVCGGQAHGVEVGKRGAQPSELLPMPTECWCSRKGWSPDRGSKAGSGRGRLGTDKQNKATPSRQPLPTGSLGWNLAVARKKGCRGRSGTGERAKAGGSQSRGAPVQGTGGRSRLAASSSARSACRAGLTAGRGLRAGLRSRPAPGTSS